MEWFLFLAAFLLILAGCGAIADTLGGAVIDLLKRKEDRRWNG